MQEQAPSWPLEQPSITAVHRVVRIQRYPYGHAPRTVTPTGIDASNDRQAGDGEQIARSLFLPR